MSKIDIQESIDIFMCPICSKEMRVCDSNRIVCLNKHNYDLSKTGYVNLLSRPVKKDYDKKMLRSRNLICKSNFFEPVIEQISSLVSHRNNGRDLNKLKILDAGCGEGSHIAQVINKLSVSSSISVMGFGIDISKDGIQLASKAYPGIVYCVADLARLPFAAKQFSVILSILSPSNYTEFNRVISDDGILIKVIPGSDYLKELRSNFYSKTEKETYSNKKVIEHYNSNFNLLDMQQIKYTTPIDKENLEHLIRMTPLSWRASDERINNMLGVGIDNVSVDLSILIGEKKKRKW